MVYSGMLFQKVMVASTFLAVSNAFSSLSLSTTAANNARIGRVVTTTAFRFPRPAANDNDNARTKLSLSKQSCEFAIIFDCDGVIIETEELHRQAYNAAFHSFRLRVNGEPVNWSVDYYDFLQNTVGGGKGKMLFHFRNTTKAFPTYVDLSSTVLEKRIAPRTSQEECELIDRLQAYKTELYKDFIEEKGVARPGVLELMDEALSDPTIAVGVCSASTKAAVTKVLDVTLGKDRTKKLDVCILGDDVDRLKPDPLIYVTAAKRLGNMDPRRCVVIEDSLIGLKAAKGAGMKCIITYTKNTEKEDFYGFGADAKVPDLASRGVTLDQIFGPMRLKLNAEILNDVKDSASVSRSKE